MHRIILALALLRAATSFAANPVAPLLTEERTSKVDFVWFSGTPGKTAKGGTSPASIIVKPNSSGDIRVAVYEELSGGAGPQWRASVWISSFLSSLTLGRTLTDYEFGVSTAGLVDGPSAGALTTAAMMAAMLGTPVDPAATMTGTVNPDGTIGPVGGIPQKIIGAAAKGKKTFGFPVGQRYSKDMMSLALVDLQGLGAEKKVQTRELKDIYDAYAVLTGKKLERPTPLDASDMDLPPDTFDRMQATSSGWLKRTASLLSKSPKLTFTKPQAAAAAALGDKARRYQVQAMAAPAYFAAIQSAALANTAVDGEATMGALLKKDLPRAVKSVAAAAKVNDDLEVIYKKLATLRPKTASGAMTVLSTWDAFVNAWAFTTLANVDIGSYEGLLAGVKKGVVPAAWAPYVSGPNGTEAVTLLLGQRLLAAELRYTSATYSLERAADVLSTQREEGPTLELDPAKVSRLARVYASAAKANLDYYDSLITASEAEQTGQSLGAAQAAKASKNYDYQYANVLLKFAVEHRNDEGLGPAMAALAAGLRCYLRSAQLIASDYSLGVHLVNGTTVVEQDKALASMLELAEAKAREQAAVARAAAGEVPTAALVEYQAARADREGGVDDKLTALYGFWKSSAYSQLVALMYRDAVLSGAAPPPPPSK